jgi:hypothetical protein
LLDVIQDQQQPTALEPVDQHLEHRAGALRPDTKGSRDGSSPARGVADSGQVDIRHLAQVGWHRRGQPAGYLQCQPCLADSARADQRDQVDRGVAEQRADGGNLVVAADNSGRRRGRRGRPRARRPRGRLGEPFRQQDGEVSASSSARSSGLSNGL